MTAKKVTTRSLVEMKGRGEKIAVLTAYDFLTAQYLDEAGIDVILVGDSAGMVFSGYPNTLPVTMEDMLYHVRAVSRGVRNGFVVADMPFLTFQVSIPEAIRNAGRFLQEGGAEAVKLEGGRHMVETARALVDRGIPVMGHLGLTPQSVHQVGGYRLQATTNAAAHQLVTEAKALQEAGCFSIVLEKVPWQVAREATAAVSIPTIGIGAGPHCDGQVLVVDDMLGRFVKFVPRFVKQYAHLAEDMRKAFEAYREDVKAGRFPGDEHSYSAEE
jgi:3-methyl-2-oxobutanoate hydroxymethyltransferase